MDTRWIKSKIIERYGKEHVIFNEICGRRDIIMIICFRKMANHVINDKWYRVKLSTIEEEMSVLSNMLPDWSDSICEVQYHISKSPTLEQIRDKYLTAMGASYAKNLTANKLRQTSIGQSIVQGYCSKQFVPPHKDLVAESGARWSSKPVDLDLLSHQFCLVWVFHWIQNLDVNQWSTNLHDWDIPSHTTRSIGFNSHHYKSLSKIFLRVF